MRVIDTPTVKSQHNTICTGSVRATIAGRPDTIARQASAGSKSRRKAEGVSHLRPLNAR